MTWRFVRSHVYLMVPRQRFWLIGKAKILEPFLVGSVGLKFPKSGAQGQRFSRKIFEPRMNSYFPMAWCCRTNRMAVPSSQKSFGKPKLAWKEFWKRIEKLSEKNCRFCSSGVCPTLEKPVLSGRLLGWRNRGSQQSSLRLPQTIM